MRILGIETSCDETSAAIVEGQPNNYKVRFLSNVVTSSLNLHSETGGIIPEIAAREQVKYIIPVIKKALTLYSSSDQAKPESREVNNETMKQLNNETIDAIAVTVGPGLIGSLLVGVETARTLSYVWKKPIIPVNHLIGHIYANFIQRTDDRRQKADVFSPPIFPAIALIVSGGHTDLVLLKNHGAIKWLGGTRDDAAGEAFDKIGRLLNLPYPGGPAIEKEAKMGNPKAHPFPRPMINSKDFDFSFSGLKTAALREIQGVRTYSSSESRAKSRESREVPRDKFSTGSNNKIISNMAASVQQAIIDVLVTKTLKAAQKYTVKSILLGGGFAANQKLRDELQLKIENFKLKIQLSVPPKDLCTDNAAMIATAAFFNYKKVPWQKITANPELYFE
jgi:N6-L-threonylcarbamoyladenine synthase